MFKQHLLLVFGFFLFSISSLKAQSTTDELIKQAIEAYNNQSFIHSIDLLREAINSTNNTTNEEIQYWLSKCHSSIKDWRTAQKELGIYFDLKPNTTSQRYSEMERLKLSINQMLIAEEADYRKANASKSVDDIKNYLNSYPYGKYRDDLSKVLSDSEQDEADWNKAKARNSVASYWEYVDKYPSGIYTEVAKKTLASWDKTAYNKAVAANTVSACEYYLKFYPRGNYRTEVQTLLNNIAEEEVYQAATRSNNIVDYETYIAKYPKGKYANTVNEFLKKSYLAEADKFFDAKSYNTAKSYYEKFVLKYPKDAQVDYAQDRIKKCQKRQKTVSHSDRFYIDYHFDNLAFVGLSLGTLKQRGVGGYFSLRMNFQDLNKNDIYDYDETLGYVDGLWDRDLIEFNDLSSQGKIVMNMGLTLKLFQPLWIYTGVGAALNTQYKGIDLFYSNGDFKESKWAKHIQNSSINAEFEAGLQLDLKGLNLRYGISYSNYLGIINTFGIGFSGKRTK